MCRGKKRNFVVLVNYETMEIEEIWQSDYETSKNMAELSEKVGRKYYKLGMQYCCNDESRKYGVMGIRASNIEIALLQLPLMEKTERTKIENI